MADPVDLFERYKAQPGTGGGRTNLIEQQRAAAEAASGGIDREIDDWSAYAPRRPAGEILGDVATVGHDAATFGFGAKADAKLDEKLAGDSYDAALARRRQAVKEAGERLGLSGKVLAELGGGSITGGLLAKLGATILGRVPGAAPLWQKMAAGTAEGAAYGAAHGAGHTDDGNYLENMGKGAVGGGVIGAGVPVALTAAQRLLTPFPMVNPQGRGPLVQTADELKIPLSAGDRTGAPMLRTFEDTTKKLPGGNIWGGSRTNDQMGDVTREAMSRSGMPTPPGAVATHGAIDEGLKDVGGKIGAIQSGYHILPDARLPHDIAPIVARLPQLEPGQQGPIQHYISRLTDPAGLAPQAAQDLRTQLRQAMQGRPNDPYQRELQAVSEALDDSLARTMAARGAHDEVQQLNELRQQYANLNTLVKAINASGQSGQRGVLTPSALQTGLSQSIGRGDYARGRGDLNDLAAMSSGLLRSPPDSFTATRLNLTEPAALLKSPLALINRRPISAWLGNQVAPHPMSGAAMVPEIGAATAAGGDRQPAGPVREITDSATRDLIERARHLRKLLQ